MTSQPRLVGLDVRDQVAVITLDSPANRNALSRQLVAELSAHLQAADDRSDVRAIVVTHTGNTFCSGADLVEAAAQGMHDATRSLLGLLRLVVALPTPVVAVVQGHARAGGVGLVGACDLALCTDASTFAFTEALLGLTPAVISLTTSTRLTEREAALKYLTGATFDGKEAARCGLLTASVSPDALDAAMWSLLAQLLQSSPQGLRETKRLLNAPLLARMDADGGGLVELSARLFGSEEARLAMAAFRERRPPPWATDRSHP